MENFIPTKSPDLNPTRHAFHLLKGNLNSANPAATDRGRRRGLAECFNGKSRISVSYDLSADALGMMCATTWSFARSLLRLNVFLGVFLVLFPCHM